MEIDATMQESKKDLQAQGRVPQEGLPFSDEQTIKNSEFEAEADVEGANERPPLFKRWRGWYGFVLLVLAILILLFYLFTKHYN